MDKKKFNELIKLQKYDTTARNELCCVCLSYIKRRLISKCDSDEIENLSHSILEYFLRHLPKRHIYAPCSYLNKSIDNYLSTNKKRADRTTDLIHEIAYEQQFTALEKFEVFRKLETVLGKDNAYLTFMCWIEDEKQTELAKRLNMSYEVVRQRICRCKKVMQTYYESVTKSDK